MASPMVAALLVFVFLMVGKAGAAVPTPPSDRCGVVCAIACLYGNEIDERGCPTCRCRKNCVPAVCPTIKCAYGLQRDENGCEVCACNPRPECPLIKCTRNCPYGYVYKKGCRTCTCRSGYKCQDTCGVFCEDRIAMKSALCAQCPCV